MPTHKKTAEAQNDSAQTRIPPEFPRVPVMRSDGRKRKQQREGCSTQRFHRTKLEQIQLSEIRSASLLIVHYTQTAVFPFNRNGFWQKRPRAFSSGLCVNFCFPHASRVSNDSNPGLHLVGDRIRPPCVCPGEDGKGARPFFRASPHKLDQELFDIRAAVQDLG